MTMQVISPKMNEADVSGPVKLKVQNLEVFYGNFRALNQINLDVPEKKITAIIGPSGCGKSTLLRSFNRMNDLTPGCRMGGEVILDGENLLAPGVDVVEHPEPKIQSALTMVHSEVRCDINSPRRERDVRRCALVPLRISWVSSLCSGMSTRIPS